MTKRNQLDVFVATPLKPEHAQLVTELEPRINLIYEPDLVGVPSAAGDYQGPLFKSMTAEQEQCYFELANQAQVHFGILRPSVLRKAVLGNPGLAWVQGNISGAGQMVKNAELPAEALARCIFTTAAGVHARPLAEWALMGVLEGAKLLPTFRNFQQQKIWPKKMPVKTLQQMTAVIVGMGNIGRELGQLLGSLGMHVIGVNRSKRLVEGVKSVVGMDRLVEMAAKADAFICCLPAAVGTEKIISAEVLATLKPGVTFISLGRGTTVDQEALIAEIESGRIGYALLDVFEREPLEQESKLWELPNVTIYPHTAGLTSYEDEMVARLFAENATRFLDSKPLLNVVNTLLWY